MHTHGRAAHVAVETNRQIVVFRLMQLVDQLGYNTSKNDIGGATVELYDAYNDDKDHKY